MSLSQRIFWASVRLLLPKICEPFDDAEKMCMRLLGTTLVLLVQQSAGLIVGVRPAYACASRAGTPSAITLPAKVLAAGSALAFWRRRSNTAGETSERFAGMEWADAPESLDADGCEMIGKDGDQGCAPPSCHPHPVPVRQVCGSSLE